jgi:serine/threonine protein kinase
MDDVDEVDDLALQLEVFCPLKLAKEQPFGPGVMIERDCPFGYNIITQSSSETRTEVWFRTDPIDVVYVDFGVDSLSADMYIYALRRAVQLKSTGVSLRGPPFVTKPCLAKPIPPMFYVVPDRSLRVIDFHDLSKPVESIKHKGLDIVDYLGRECVHKYMSHHRESRSFEQEVAVYCKISGSQYIPEFLGVTKEDGFFRGFLIQRIPGENLVMDESVNDDDRLELAVNIIRALRDLESRGYYPQDLKCYNIIRKKGSNDVGLIDFGEGITLGWCDPETQEKVNRGEITARDALYILGKTLQELWTNDVPTGDMPDTIPASIRSLIQSCCKDRTYSTVAELAEAMELN